MPINIANFQDSDRRSAKAGEAMTMGMVVKVSDDGLGGRKLMKLADGDSALLVAGKYALAYKVSADAAQVVESTADAATGSRLVAIASGDAVVEVRRGSIVEFSADLLGASLDPARSGTTPTVGADLHIKGSQFVAAGTGGAISSPVVARVFKVFGTKVLVELL